jgi:hypothetical protein
VGTVSPAPPVLPRYTCTKTAMLNGTLTPGVYDVSCNTELCSPNNVCCGPDDGKYYCAGHCSCKNYTSVGEVRCDCDYGFHGTRCLQQVSPTVWLAVILTVGTMLVLFIAWGFRCNEDDDDLTQIENAGGGPRHPLLREASERAAAAARPPTIRGTTENYTEDVSCTGAGSSEAASLQRRTCCVCLAKPLQVVLIPCGHACVCRRCSRKLETCPLCRNDIQATQRFYF